MEKTFKHRWLWTILTTLAILISGSLAGAADLRVGVDTAFVPFEFKGKDGRYTGFDVDLWDGIAKRIITTSQAKRINSPMLTCGTYDAVGDFAYRVGLLGKSGVGGGIAAFIPGRLCVAVWSPGLNANGNSLAGIQALEWFTTKTGMSIF